MFTQATEKGRKHRAAQHSRLGPRQTWGALAPQQIWGTWHLHRAGVLWHPDVTGGLWHPEAGGISPGLALPWHVLSC